MIPYSMTQLLFFFFIYCFIGWIIESTYVSLHSKKLTNRGFMRGPVIPIYGCGAMTLLLVGTPLKAYPVAMFFAGLVACSILEYFTGAAMEAIFKVRYWDYSNEKWNLNGYICWWTSLVWGGLALAENYILHRPIEALSNLLSSKALSTITMIVGIVFLVDLTLSFKAAFDLRAAIIKLEKAKDELRLMQRRLDVMIAYANADAEAKWDSFEERLDDIHDAIEDRVDDIQDAIGDRVEDIQDAMEEKFAKIKERIDDVTDEKIDAVKDEFMELRAKFAARKETHYGLDAVRDFYKRSMIKGNPTMASKKFKGSFESLKDFMNSKK